MRIVALLCVLGTPLFAQEPGAVPVKSIKVRELAIVPRKGDAQEALATFLKAHRAHKKGDLDAALDGYLAYLGIAARAKLPPRYDETARGRLATLRAGVTKGYAAATALYAKDGARGVAELKKLAARYPALPEGVAALRLWQSDELRRTLTEVRDAPDKRAAAKHLEQAIKKLHEALYRYEAKSTLVELGGPDLFEPGERVAEQAADDGDTDDEDDDEGETVIETGDD
ncbi:MAG: hypothetical protein ACYTGN_10710 [Planctomycetota bacterium]|jgi:hypothetical protein